MSFNLSIPVAGSVWLLCVKCSFIGLGLKILPSYEFCISFHITLVSLIIFLLKIKVKLSSNIFMFLFLKHVYIPLLFFSGVDYIDAPTPYMMGLHSGVDTSTLAMDGVSYFIHVYLF